MINEWEEKIERETGLKRAFPLLLHNWLEWNNLQREEVFLDTYRLNGFEVCIVNLGKEKKVYAIQNPNTLFYEVFLK